MKSSLKSLLPAGIALAFVMCAPAVLAAGNPTVDLTQLVNPGQWEVTSNVTQNGKTVAIGKTKTVCLTKAQLKDFLNIEGMGKVDSHSLKDKHLHVEMSEGHATTVLDGYYTDPNHAHGTTRTTVSAEVDGKTRQVVTLNKFKGSRVSDTCATGAGS